jgi:predicted dienelactone hydrolase
MRRRSLLGLIALVVGTSVLAAPDPTRPGRLAVGVTTVAAVDGSRGDRTLPTEIWYPARRTGRDVAPLPHRWPLVLIAHGLCGSRLYYDYLATHLASWGFVIAAPDFTGVTRAACDVRQITASIDDMALDLSFVRRMLHDRGGPLGWWARHVRGMRTGLVGNSLGGAAAVGAARTDAAFTAIVGLAPFVNAASAPPLVGLAPRLDDHGRDRRRPRELHRRHRAVLRPAADAGLPRTLHGRIAHRLLRRESGDEPRSPAGAARRDDALCDAVPRQVPRARAPARARAPVER